MEENDFYLKVAYALSGCQLVEQELKLYISEALELARKCIGTRLTFKMSGDDYADASLERLIDAFKKLSDNEVLVKDLRTFKDERNFLSHKGIATCLDYEGGLFYTTALEFQVRLDAMQGEAQRLMAELREEGYKFRGHLYFEEFPDAG